MKKIVGILAGAALLATSVFAADVNARVKLTTNLYDSESKVILSEPVTSGWDTNNTYFKLSVASDNAGAELAIWDEDSKFHNLAVWFKPLDTIKVTVGTSSCESIARGCFAWWAKTANFDSKIGVKAEGTFDAFSFETALYGNFLDLNKSGYDMVGNFWVSGKYNLGDAGTIQAIVTKGSTLNAYGVGGWKTSGLAFGVAYDHMPWEQTGFYADAFVNLTTKFKFDEVAGQIGGQYCNDALKLRLTNMVAYGDVSGTTKFSYGFAAKASYAIDTVTPYVQLLGNGIMDKSLGVEVGADVNVGICAINAAFSTTLSFAEGSTFNFKIPLYFDVQF